MPTHYGSFLKSPAGLALLLIVLVVAVFFTWFAIKRFGTNAIIRRHGLPAHAEILSARQMGVTARGHRQVAFTLEVYPPGGAPYQTTIQITLPSDDVQQFHPGLSVPVKIHPTDFRKVALGI
ncbi:MAG: hypothetical protein ACOYYS_08220 [Chloroflexota bacterium]